MKLKSQKRLVAQMLKCSKKKIVFDPESLNGIKESITKSDLRNLLKKGVIKLRKTKESSRFRARIIEKQKKKIDKKDLEAKKGKRTKGKREWINKIRIQRRLTRNLRDKGKISKKDYKDVYLKAKGGFFRSKRHVILYLEENKLFKKGK